MTSIRTVVPGHNSRDKHRRYALIVKISASADIPYVSEKETRNAHTREALKYKMDGVDYGRLLITVANGGMAYKSPVVSSILPHGPVRPDVGGGYGECQ